ncbi:sensor histidine kinase [Microbispora sp. H10885]|uniref:sensor histidine kinase n=1 Tax=Microbispora sp. H10885 TaxID=2729110 RepID=UPI00160247C9|nr:ATP-binding protein [Microbispora sp. H10885]
MELRAQLQDCVGELDGLERSLERSLGVMRGKLEAAINVQRRYEADAAHELRTPVAGLRAQLEEAQLNRAEIDLDSLLERALSDVNRLQAIIEDLHLLCELQEAARLVEPVPVDLAEVVRAQVPRCAGRHEVKVKAEPGLVVSSVPARLGRLLAELLDNAQRHARFLVRVEIRRAGDLGELVVSDDGPGIPAHERERVFGRFTRLDDARCRDRGGTGLGLAIVRNIAEMYGGSVHAEEAAGGGAALVVRLPLAHPSAPG